ncbi:MAG: WD40/YVTN/BNR-like repeat-containing protein, partial [Actinomycetota bacterium]
AYMSGAGEDTDPTLGPFFLGETAPASLPVIEGVRLGTQTAVLPAMPASQVRTAWRSLGPRSTIVRALAVNPRDPQVLYAATQERGFMVSRDRGNTWTESNRGLGPFTSLWSVEPDPRVPRRLWAATHHGGLFRSDDAGATWKPTHIAARRRSGDVRFAAPAMPVTGTQLLGNNVIFDQTGANAGGRWLYVYDQCLAEHAPAGQACATRADWPAEGFDAYPPVADFYRYASETAVMGDGTVLAAGFRSSAGGQGGVFRSRNAGSSWAYAWNNSQGTSAGNSNLWRIRRASPTRAYAAGTGGVFRTDDTGVTWNVHTPGASEIRALAVNPKNANVVYAGSWDANGGIFKTVDGGQTWAAAAEGIPERAGIAALAVDPRSSRRLAAATYWYGVYLSEDAGATWKLAANGMPALARQRLDDVDFSADGTLYASSHHGVFALAGPPIVRGVRRPAAELPGTGVPAWGGAWLLLAAAAVIGRWRTAAR